MPNSLPLSSFTRPLLVPDGTLHAPSRTQAHTHGASLMVHKDLSPGTVLGIPYAWPRLWKQDPAAARRAAKCPRPAPEGPTAVCFLFDTAFFPVSGFVQQTHPKMALSLPGYPKDCLVKIRYARPVACQGFKLCSRACFQTLSGPIRLRRSAAKVSYKPLTDRLLHPYRRGFLLSMQGLPAAARLNRTWTSSPYRAPRRRARDRS